jgi:hypothetical protein
VAEAAVAEVLTSRPNTEEAEEAEDPMHTTIAPSSMHLLLHQQLHSMSAKAKIGSSWRER